MQLGLTRRNIGRLVLLAWAVALAWLARRQFFTPEGGAADPRGNRMSPGSWYYIVSAGNRQVGQLNVSVDTLVDGVRLSDVFVVDIPSGDTTLQLAQSTEYSLSRALRLRGMKRTVFGVGPQERLELTVGADSMAGFTSSEDSFGVAARAQFRVDRALVTQAMVGFRAAHRGHLQIGQRFSLPLLDPGAGGTRDLTIQVTAESTFAVPDSAVWDSTTARWVPAEIDTVLAWRLEHDAPGAPTVTWVDAGGVTVRSETAGGLTFARSAWEMVFNNYRQTRGHESSAWRRAIPGMLPLLSVGKAPDTTAASAWFLVQTDSSGPGLDSSSAFAGGRQALHGDTLVVFRATAFDSAARNPDGQVGPGVDLPAGDPRILRAVVRATRGARSTEDSARMLTSWVAVQIATDGGERATGAALLTLRSRRGSPDGKARLMATMTRAAGIPARVVSGVAVLPQGIFAHSWTEVWLGRWVAADPTFGQFPASASLIRLAMGVRSRPPDLLPVAASARFLPLEGGQ
jgi:transglutaminase-like putative cysteine protease